MCPVEARRRANHLCEDCGRVPVCGRIRCKACLAARAGIARKHRTGVTPKQYARALEAQGGKCAICSGKNKSPRSLHADHQHATKVFRGLLCYACNVALGLFKEDPKLLRSAINYLVNPPCAWATTETP